MNEHDLSKKITPAECPFCSFSSKRLTNFEKHLNEEHQKTTKEAWDSKFLGPKLCSCGCGSETRFYGWHKGYAEFILGHNASVVDEETKNKRRTTLKRSIEAGEVINWAKGLSKQTDERVSRRARATAEGRKKAFAEGQIATWSKGLNAESDDRVRSMSETLKKKFETGELKTWSKGLTKNVDQRLKTASEKLSITMNHKHVRSRLDELKRLKVDEIRDRIESNGTFRVIDGLDSYKNDALPVILVECKTCGATTHGSLRHLQHGRCYKCNPHGSAAQEEIARFIESRGFRVCRNDRQTLNVNLELDIYVPEKKFAIEYNGLYWHSIANKSSMYHENKSSIAKQHGITLMHVFEDEWHDEAKKNIIKSMVLHRLGASSKKLHARKLSAKEISNKERQAFFDENHIDGDVAAKIAFGLFDNEELVAAISLRRPMHSTDKDYIEIARLCSKTDTIVVGGASKLLKEAFSWCRQNDCNKIMTYVDTRFGGTGECYVKSGMKLSSETTPRWWWTDFSSRFNRFKFRADKKRNLSENKVAEEKGVTKIWGCKNLVYRIELT